MSRTLARVLPALLLGVVPAVAQQSRYVGPGELSERRLDRPSAIVEMRRNARWRLGFLDIEPQLGLADLGYVSNVFNTVEQESESDLRATGIAGLRGFFNLGSDVVVSPFAGLSYSWWQQQEDLRELNESFGLQLFGDFNRLKLNLQAGRFGSQENLSSEVEVPVDLRSDQLELGLDIDFRGPFSFFFTARASDNRHFGSAAERNVSGLDLASLDADSEELAAGVGYEFPNGLKIGLGAVWRETDYLVDPGERSNESSGPLARLQFEGARLFLELEAAWRDLEFAQPGGDRQELNGSAQLSWQLSPKLSAGVYGGSQLVASALDNESIYDSRRLGVFVQRQQGERGAVGLFWEDGRDEFATVRVDEVTRSDDIRSYGLSFNVELTPRLHLDVRLFDSRRESTDPAFDRDLRGIRTLLGLGTDLLIF